MKVGIIAWLCFGAVLACVSAGPAPDVYYLKITNYYSQGSSRIVYYDQKGYQQTVLVVFNGSDVRNKCKTTKYYYQFGNVILGWQQRCEVTGSGNFVVQTPGGNIRGVNYDSKFIS